MTDPWDFDVPEIQTPTSTEAPANSQPTRDPEECAHCGRLPLHRDERASALLLSRIRADLRDRLSRTESVLAELHEADRIALARWIQEALDRPPLKNNPHRSFRVVAAVLDALWRDIYWTTPDPLSPVVDGGWTVQQPHPDIAEMREGEWVAP